MTTSIPLVGTEAPPISDSGTARQARSTSMVGWCQSARTRSEELRSLRNWVVARHEAAGTPPEQYAPPAAAIDEMLDSAEAATERSWPSEVWRLGRRAARMESAISHLDAAEAQLLNIAPADYVVGHVPSLQAHVERHLRPKDPRRIAFERVAERLAITGASHGVHNGRNGHRPVDRSAVVDSGRGTIVTAVRGASSAALREQLRVRSFRNVLIGGFFAMLALAVVIAAVGAWRPTLIPLCFAPEEAGHAIVVCPTAHSDRFATEPQANAERDIDFYTAETVNPLDLLLVEFVGMAAAAVAGAAAIRGIRASSGRHAIPLWLIALKLPTGAVTAFLGLLLMRGQFVPGLSALDTSAQILAWALVFGYAQQLFTRLVDQQGEHVLANVRGANRTPVPTDT